MTKGIYCYYDNLRCKIVYVGKDSNIDKRARDRAHCSPSNRDKQKINQILQNDNKSGRYSYAVLEQGDFTDDELNEREKYWIKYFDPKFNFTEGGDGASSGENHPMYGKLGYWKGKKRSKETREKMSCAKFGEKNPMYNKKFSKEHREKMSRARSGKKRSKETREKMRENHADFSGKNNPRFDSCIKIRKQKNKRCTQGFRWVARPYTPERQEHFSNTDLQKCIEKIQEFINSEKNVYGYTHYEVKYRNI